ncbi:MAG: class I SAM-dependent methyltransferase [Chloroflexi bacterium]|nr:class I SAM-dependent methyltransferase [Chloroflexota bacterium]
MTKQSRHGGTTGFPACRRAGGSLPLPGGTGLRACESLWARGSLPLRVGHSLTGLLRCARNDIFRPVADYYSKSLHRKLLEQEIKKIKLSGLVLDVGSKNRRYDRYFPGTRIVAIDLDPEIRDGTVVRCDARDIAFRDNLFDYVISFEVLEYIYETERVLAEIRRVLKPGGSCYFSVPLLNPVHGGAGDIVRYTRRGWLELLQQIFDRDKIHVQSFGGRYSVIFDFWFDRIRASNPVIKLLCWLPAAGWQRLCRALDRKERSERWAMGYLIRVQK